MGDEWLTGWNAILNRLPPLVPLQYTMGDEWDVDATAKPTLPPAGRGRGAGGVANLAQRVGAMQVSSNDEWGAPAAKPAASNDDWGTPASTVKPTASASTDDWGAPAAPAPKQTDSNGWGSSAAAPSKPAETGGWGSSSAASSKPAETGGWGSGGGGGGARSGGTGGSRACHKVT